ncbi:MAG TPA: hypothetical protein VGC13_13470 [Longimicrobium sp.]|jgi:hypothetical protein|uniref:hypothetical protein n=1 Tax=Longimicrobium sp. TaxID=2029185 RepID=UPI002ED7D111
MRQIVHLTCILVLAALAGTVPAEAQRERTHLQNDGETHIVDDNGSRRLEMRLRGDVQINEAGDWITSVGPRGLFTVEEREGGTTRRVEFRPGDGGARARYSVNGRERTLDASGRAWAQRLILHAVRRSGLGAQQRVASIRGRSGVSGVLAEIARLEGDVARRAYYNALLGGDPLSTAEFGRVMDDVGRRMGSDVETRLVLTQAADRAGGGARLAALLRAAEGIDSDVETRLVLTHVSRRHRLADAASREAFFRAVGGLESDVERRLVLNAVADERLAEGPSREAFFRAVGEMDSDVERRLVLSQVMRGDAPEATVIAAIHSAGQMSSDVEKRLVLTQVPSAHLRGARVASAYRRVAEAMRSQTERRLALRRLDGSR